MCIKISFQVNYERALLRITLHVAAVVFCEDFILFELCLVLLLQKLFQSENLEQINASQGKYAVCLIRTLDIH